MATVTPTAVAIGPNVTRVTWAGMVTGDTITAYSAPSATRASLQATGTFAGGTVIGITASLDGTNFAAVTDTLGTAITGLTAAFLVEIGAAATDYKPTIGSGTSDSVTVTLVIWS